MRHAVNLGLLFAFLTLAVTGVMAFVLPFSLVTTRVHVVAGLSTLVLVTVHILERVRYFKMQVTGRSRAALPRRQQAALLILWGGIVAAALVALSPVRWLIDQGYEARNRAQIVRASSLVGFGDLSPQRALISRMPRDPAGHGLSLMVSFSEADKAPPAYAVWAETKAGTLIETLYLPTDLAFADSVDWHGAPTRRNHILPIWRNRYTIVSGLGPDGKVDAVSGATETHEFALDAYLVPNQDRAFILCVEVNLQGDANPAWPDPHIGQPSLLYTAVVEVDDENPYDILELTAHGGNAETSGTLHYDLSGFTTAKDLVDLLLAKVEKPNPP